MDLADTPSGAGGTGHGDCPSAVEARRRVARRGVLLAFGALTALVAVVCWRYVPEVLAWLGDPQAVRSFVADHAVASRLVMVGINVVQVLLAFLPGEPVELASGYAFGFWEGTALCLVASAFATAAIFAGVRRWGWRLVGLFFDRSLLERFAWLRDSKRMELLMLIVFLIPGTPKDFLTYFAGLTEARFVSVLLIATFGRLPSIVTSTLAASAVGDGDWTVALATLAVAGLLLAFGALAFRRLEASRKR